MAMDNENESFWGKVKESVKLAFWRIIAIVGFLVVFLALFFWNRCSASLFY